MNFLRRLKEQLNDPRTRQGMRGRAMVDAGCLRELLYQYEAMDSMDRAMSVSPGKAASHLLHEAVLALYHNTKDPVLVMNVVMEALNPLVKQEVEDKNAKVHFHDSYLKEAIK
jgi:hypothetical protein